MNKKTNQLIKSIIALSVIIASVIGFSSYSINENLENNISTETSYVTQNTSEIYIEINNNIPNFSNEDFSIEEDYYSELQNGKVRNGNDKNELGKSKHR